MTSLAPVFAAFADDANRQRLAYLILIDLWRAHNFALHRYTGEVLTLDWAAIMSAAFKVSNVVFAEGDIDRCLLLKVAADAERSLMYIERYAMLVLWRGPFNQIVLAIKFSWFASPPVLSLGAKRGAAWTAATFAAIWRAFDSRIWSSQRMSSILI